MGRLWSLGHAAPQTWKPELQETWQWLATHDDVPFTGSVHEVWHVPQYCLLLVVSTQLDPQTVGALEGQLSTHEYVDPLDEQS